VRSYLSRSPFPRSCRHDSPAREDDPRTRTASQGPQDDPGVCPRRGPVGAVLRPAADAGCGSFAANPGWSTRNPRSPVPAGCWITSAGSAGCWGPPRKPWPIRPRRRPPSGCDCCWASSRTAARFAARCSTPSRCCPSLRSRHRVGSLPSPRLRSTARLPAPPPHQEGRHDASRVLPTPASHHGHPTDTPTVYASRPPGRWPGPAAADSTPASIPPPRPFSPSPTRTPPANPPPPRRL